jgi:obg-like ATPase 1
MGIPAENFPFCTIDPNNARVNVPDERFQWLCKSYKPKSEVPAFLEIVDIAGLVKGAATGEGLGNAFLSNIMAVDGIFHVCRAFEDSDVVHVEDRVNPVEDLEIIRGELRAKDVERLIGHIETMKKLIPRGLKKEQKDELAAAEKVLEYIQAGNDIRFGDWNLVETDFLNNMQLITAKPVVYLVNLSERDYARKKNKWLPKVFEWIQQNSGGEPLIPFSGALEAKLFDMADEEKDAYCKEAECVSALPKIIVTGFKAVQLIYFFTAGSDEVKCWQIRKGTKAPQAAGAIHTDFERGFICAEVMHHDELKELGTENGELAVFFFFSFSLLKPRWGFSDCI